MNKIIEKKIIYIYIVFFLFIDTVANAQDLNQNLSWIKSTLSSPILPLIFIFVIFYFFLIRPQQKKTKEHNMMLENIRPGDRVITSGGIIGLVTKIENNYNIEVEISNNVNVIIIKNTILNVLLKNSSNNIIEDAQSEKKKSEIYLKNNKKNQKRK